ncbi:MAG: hypothetical protein ACJAU6_000310 [Alphaproteobacteria bacterium]|jgi:hypothetical protein
MNGTQINIPDNQIPGAYHTRIVNVCDVAKYREDAGN